MDKKKKKTLVLIGASALGLYLFVAIIISSHKTTQYDKPEIVMQSTNNSRPINYDSIEKASRIENINKRNEIRKTYESKLKPYRRDATRIMSILEMESFILTNSMENYNICNFEYRKKIDGYIVKVLYTSSKSFNQYDVSVEVLDPSN